MQEEQGQKHGNPVADGWAGAVMQTRPDTWQPKLRAGGQGPYLRSLDLLGKNREVKEIKS